MDNTSHTLYETLISILKKEIEICRELHASLADEREVLAGSSADELYQSNARKEACILKAGMLEEARTRLIERIAATLGIEERGLNLSKLLSHAGDDQRRKLKECRSILRSLLTDINELNERNKMLLDASLSHAQRSIDFLGQLIYPGATYLNTGRLKTNSMNGRIVSREG